MRGVVDHPGFGVSEKICDRLVMRRRRKRVLCPGDQQDGELEIRKIFRGVRAMEQCEVLPLVNFSRAIENHALDPLDKCPVGAVFWCNDGGHPCLGVGCHVCIGLGDPLLSFCGLGGARRQMARIGQHYGADPILGLPPYLHGDAAAHGMAHDNEITGRCGNGSRRHRLKGRILGRVSNMHRGLAAEIADNIVPGARVGHDARDKYQCNHVALPIQKQASGGTVDRRFAQTEVDAIEGCVTCWRHPLLSPHSRLYRFDFLKRFSFLCARCSHAGRPRIQSKVDLHDLLLRLSKPIVRLSNLRACLTGYLVGIFCHALTNILSVVRLATLSDPLLDLSCRMAGDGLAGRAARTDIRTRTAPVSPGARGNFLG